MKHVLIAQSININGQPITGPLSSSFTTVASVINALVVFVIPIASLILLFVLIFGGYSYMMSQGNPEKIKSAQGMITSALIGFALLVFSYFIIKLITTIFGINVGIL